MTSDPANSSDASNFNEFRRKVKSAEVLSASMERLLLALRFTGRVSVVMQNGRVLKSGYEEGYFRQHAEFGGVDDCAQKSVEAEEVDGKHQLKRANSPFMR